jgi:hypothetical protein
MRNHCCRIIGRAVIYNDDCVRLSRLVPGTRNCFGQKMSVIKRRNDHADRFAARGGRCLAKPCHLGGVRGSFQRIVWIRQDLFHRSAGERTWDGDADLSAACLFRSIAERQDLSEALGQPDCRSSGCPTVCLLAIRASYNDARSDVFDGTIVLGDEPVELPERVEIGSDGLQLRGVKEPLAHV